MIDIAIGVIIGTAFNKVIDVLVKEIFLPPLSYLTDGTNWENKRWILREAVIENGIVSFGDWELRNKMNIILCHLISIKHHTVRGSELRLGY